MAYYIVDSSQDNMGTEGYMYLYEVQGESMPKPSLDYTANWFTRKEYFSTYEEAKEFFQSNFEDYIRSGSTIDTWDKVVNDRCFTNR